LKPSFISLPATTTLVAAVLIAAAGVAQAPPAGNAPPHEHEHGPMPAPTNLKVLPKNLTGEQVHEIMHGWSAALGVRCGTCHATNPKDIGPDGRARFNYADDSKDEKKTARKMYLMVEDINTNTIAKIDSSGDPVTCGTCHRGHLAPEPWVAPKDDHAHPPGGEKPPIPK